VHTGFWWGNLRERDHLEDLGLDGRIILNWVFKKLVGGHDWLDLSWDRERWWALVKAVILGFHRKQGISRLPEDLLASQEGLHSMELNH
jgi:hypothetical protein